MRPALFSQARIDSFPQKVARPDVRAGFIQRNEGEALIDFLGRIVVSGYKSFRLDSVATDSLARSHEFIDKATVDEYAAKIATIDPPMIDEETGEIINGNHRFEAYKKLARASLPVIICSRA